VRVLTRDGPLRRLAGVWRLFDALALYSVNGGAIVYLFCFYPQVEPTEKMMNGSQSYNIVNFNAYSCRFHATHARLPAIHN
jgi:hypothetical protein